MGKTIKELLDQFEDETVFLSVLSGFEDCSEAYRNLLTMKDKTKEIFQEIVETRGRHGGDSICAHEMYLLGELIGEWPKISSPGHIPTMTKEWIAFGKERGYLNESS